MLGVLAVLALILGFACGWLAHRAVSIHYKKRWLELVGLMNSKALEPDTTRAQIAAAYDVPPVMLKQGPYIPGRWALDQRTRGDTIEFYAVRMGFDDVPLGKAKSTYGGIVKMARSNAEQTIAEMNGA